METEFYWMLNEKISINLEELALHYLGVIIVPFLRE